MVYLRSFHFLTRGEEEGFLYYDHSPNAYLSKYPFNVFRYRELPDFEFDPITILYGTNGSGKSTLLNVIAEKLHIKRHSAFNDTDFFPEYVRLCKCETASQFRNRELMRSGILTSDDVFDYLLDMRNLNANVDRRREDLFEEYARINAEVHGFGEPFQMRSLADYDELAKRVDVARKGSSPSDYFRRRGIQNVAENSNGENALQVFTERIQSNALYLLDEPENSLSAERQLELKQFILDSARFYQCQFVIATHSPFFLSIKDAKIYNLDETPPRERHWTELPNMRAYFELFMDHRREFQSNFKAGG